MSDSNKLLLFLLGLVIGLLAGTGFFIFKMNDIIKKINVFKSSRDTIIIQQQTIEQKKGATDLKKYAKKDTTNNSMTSAEILAQKYLREIPIKQVIAESDSLLKDTAFSPNNLTNEPFILRKDELLEIKIYEITNLQQKDSNSDSLIEKISGIKNQKNMMTSFKVEFWQSPINYKGYKMSKNKVVLFGINPYDEIKFFYYEEGIIMKQNQNYFRLYFTDEYKQFEKIADLAVINKMK